MTVENQTELHCDDCGVHFGDAVDGHSAVPSENTASRLSCQACAADGKFEISGYDFTGEASPPEAK